MSLFGIFKKKNKEEKTIKVTCNAAGNFSPELLNQLIMQLPVGNRPTIVEKEASISYIEDDGRKVEVKGIPLLTIVPIPSLNIDEVDISFDREVAKAAKSEPKPKKKSTKKKSK